MLQRFLKLIFITLAEQTFGLLKDLETTKDNVNFYSPLSFHTSHRELRRPLYIYLLFACFVNGWESVHEQYIYHRIVCFGRELGTQEAFRTTSCLKWSQLWGCISLIKALSSQVLKNSIDGHCFSAWLSSLWKNLLLYQTWTSPGLFMTIFFFCCPILLNKELGVVFSATLLYALKG